MDIIEKLKILSNDSQYDLACACGTSRDDRRKRGLEGKWIYPITLPNGGYSVVLKTLLSNVCSNDCKYCPLRFETDIKRCTLQPEEVANIFMEYVRKKKVFGLFLSSGVINNPDHTMDRINAVARILRYKHGYKGYIHLKIIPGASDSAIEDAFSLASAVSLNIETPGKKRFDLLSNKKDYEKDIIRPLKLMSKLRQEKERFSKVKCTTQFIVGASNEKDIEIVKYMFGIYRKLRFQRIYFSSYQKGLGHPDIPGEKRSDYTEISFVREHRLYQADFLIRKYGFESEDIIFDKDGNLSLEKDPKQLWADNHPEFYPVRINKADSEELLRVPGIGLKAAMKILRARREMRITSLENIGIKGKRLEKIKPYVIFE
jgi:predicted DNA-binding helix-hairpin-helix protein